jgi:hypothetical protein
LQGVPRDPDLIFTIECSLERVLDLTVPALHDPLGTSNEELVSSTPSRFILNARNEETPTQQLGSACSYSGGISALKVPSAAHPDGFCPDILIASLIVGEHISIRDETGRITSEIVGKIPKPLSP